MSLRPPVLHCILAVLALLIAAPPAAAQVENLPPRFLDGVVLPPSLEADGGQITLTAIVLDDMGIESVTAEIVGENGTYIYADLAPTGGGAYSNVAFLPANDTEYPISYMVNIVARDTGWLDASWGAGSVVVQGRQPFNDPPFVTDPLVTPRELPGTGGAVTAAVSAWDLGGISSAYVTFREVGGTETVRLDLNQIGETRFETKFRFPENTASTARTWSATFTALDDIGQETHLSGGDLVIGPAVPAAPAKLSVSPDVRWFGAVRVGRAAERTVTIRNVGGSRATGVVAPVAAPFVAGTGSPAGVPFDLGAGESVNVRVLFLPGSLGLATRRLRIRRADGQQAGLGVTLSGLGIPRR